MARKAGLPGSTFIFALAAMSAQGQAAPVGGSAREVVPVDMAAARLQQVANRVCWTEGGIRRCRSLNNVRVYGYQSPRAYRYRAPAAGYQAPAFYGVAPPIGYGYIAREQVETDPNLFPVGSTDWWQAMDALDRGGQGNGQGAGGP
jgi:hypothetical protein